MAAIAGDLAAPVATMMIRCADVISAMPSVTARVPGGVSVTFQSALGKLRHPAPAIRFTSGFVEANMAIHADAKKLHAETAILENGRPMTLSLEIRPGCLPVNC